MKVGDLVSHLDHPRLIGIVIKTGGWDTSAQMSVPCHTIKWFNEKDIPHGRRWRKPTIFSQSVLKLLSEA
jgi:hypothetical protein|tara:strand:- start:27 stop:236 length:210 start_codon:yes stop_codon:yes gene_type:complete